MVKKYVFQQMNIVFLLTGYDYEHSVVHIMRPMKGNVTYDMALFNYRFNQIGNQAVKEPFGMVRLYISKRFAVK